MTTLFGGVFRPRVFKGVEKGGTWGVKLVGGETRNAVKNRQIKTLLTFPGQGNGVGFSLNYTLGGLGVGPLNFSKILHRGKRFCLY